MAKKTATKTSGKRRTTTRSTKKAGASKPTAKRSAKTGKGRRKTAAVTAGDEEVTIDRRRGERRDQETATEEPTAAPLERRKKVNRRRQIDPTTCERDYTEVEVEFMNALDEYKRTSGRMFPTCSEVLEVIRGLGYVKASPAQAAAMNSPDPAGADQQEAEFQSTDLQDAPSVAQVAGTIC